MRFRTFIAVDVSPFSRDRLLGIQQQLATVAEGVNWVEAENMHLTMIFLGEVNDRDLADVCRAVSDGAKKVRPFSFTVSGLGAFPTPRRPRTLIAKIAEGHDELVALHQAIEPGLMELGCYRREERAFNPHVTLGRVKGDGDADQLTAALLKFGAWSGGETQVKEVRVLTTQRGADRTKYAVLSRARLSGA
jgi:RNA 2',3'-cyclic 3'-phosphodiesterase